jgi:hypothetical protein
LNHVTATGGCGDSETLVGCDNWQRSLIAASPD